MKRLALSVTLVVLMGACSETDVPPAPDAAPSPAPDRAEAPIAVSPPPVDPAPIPGAVLCRGNEPYWALDIHVGGALLRTPESEIELLGELKANEGGSFAFRGATDGSPGDAVSALIAPGQCFDTMADGPAMPFSAQVSLPGGQVASGCCSVE